MNHDHSTTEMKSHWRTYVPLIIVFAAIILWTIVAAVFIRKEFSLNDAMADFMGGFFFIFGVLQIINWKKFAESFSAYDLIAGKSRFYAYLFPVIELTLAAAYIFRFQLTLANIATLTIFGIASIGVARALRLSKGIPCACLGGIFTLPLSWVTLFEDLLMAAMAAMALLI